MRILRWALILCVLPAFAQGPDKPKPAETAKPEIIVGLTPACEKAPDGAACLSEKLAVAELRIAIAEAGAIEDRLNKVMAENGYGEIVKRRETSTAKLCSKAGLQPGCKVDVYTGSATGVPLKSVDGNDKR